MIETIRNIGWSMVFSVVGGLLGMVLVLVASLIVPGLIDRLTPDIDEQKEIARGNSAVAEYFGRLVSAAILGREHCGGCCSAGWHHGSPALSMGSLTRIL